MAGRQSSASAERVVVMVFNMPVLGWKETERRSCRPISSLMCGLSDGERNAGARAAPVELERAAGRGVADRDRDLFGRAGRLLHCLRRAPEILTGGIRNAPARCALAHDQLPLALDRNHVETI